MTARAETGPTGGSPTTALGSSAQPLAALHDVALLDLDGVVYLGTDAVPHAAEALEEAVARYGTGTYFVTNNAARAPAEAAAHLVELGIPATADEIVTSAQAGARMLAEHLAAGSPVLAIGGPGVPAALRSRGFVPVESADEEPLGVLQGFGPDVGWRQLAEGSLAINGGALWVATNLDATLPTPRGPVVGNGSLVAALRNATGAEPLAAGKPEPPLMLESIDRSGARNPLAVGDRLDTDIAGAHRTGIPSLLVLTGVTDWRDLLTAEPGFRPTYLDRDLRGLLRPQPPVEAQAHPDEVVASCRRASVRVPTGLAGSAGSEGWLPERIRSVRGLDFDDAELDLARALLAAAWMAADSGLTLVGPAQVLS